MNIKQYRYSGCVEDNWWKSNKIKCALCSTDIRYEFELKNINDENGIIKVWCECAKKFEWTPYKILTKDKRKYVKDQKRENILNILSQLIHLNSKFDYLKVIKYFEDRGWFTPKQILVIYKDITKYKIEFNNWDFKVKAIRNREKEQILNLNSSDKIIISKFLTIQQKQRFNLM